MTTEEIQATKRTKAQIQQEEVGVAEAMRLQALKEEEAARQVYFDALIAKRISEEEELSEQQKKRKAESLQGESMTSEDFVKRMVEMINQKKKFYAEEKAKARRSKPMTQAHQRDYIILKNFMPMETDKRVKRQGVQLEQEFSKKQKTIEEVSVLEESITESGGGVFGCGVVKDESKEEREAFMKDKVTSASSESEIGIDSIPTATKPPSIVDWKIIPQSGLKVVYQIIRRDGFDKIYMSFGAILKDFSRDNLTKLYRLVIKKYGVNRPEEIYDRVLWGDLKTMFDPPLRDDAIWNRKYPLSKDACQEMLKMKLLDGTTDEVCYQLLKMIEKQAGLR
ncbi:hypothetical protein Tco_0628849 [Tanacetum coccineum]|uniref:Uncharacterized protein n=1 Tax=Tanacetum coccineum TaxID=301880 RepID=A0ABQ4WRF2_9ASTR